jgi:multicomponent Na+:H+ antiporter subunit A
VSCRLPADDTGAQAKKGGGSHVHQPAGRRAEPVILFVVLAGMASLALFVPAISRRYGRDTGYFLAIGFVLLGVVLAPSVAVALQGMAVEGSLPWLPAIGASATLRLDGLASLFALLVIGVGALIFAYCPRYLHGDHHTRTYVLLTVFAVSMLGLVLAADLVLLFVFWELTTVSSFLLIGGSGAKSARPAMRALIITASGGLALLVAVVLIGVAAGTTYLPHLLDNPDLVLASPLAMPIGALLLLAAFTKSAQLPFHSWLPGAMVAITPVSAYLHAATMVKAGIYLLMRFSPVYGDEPAWQATLVGVGLLTAIVGAALALRQHDLKALLAYSTVSQLGLIVAVTGVGSPVGLGAAVVHTFAHALFKATLFMLVGIIDREAGSRDVRELGGLWRVMPVTATLTGLAGLSLAGVPPLLGFVSKETIFQALASTGVTPWAGAVAAALGVTASALTFAYGVRIFHGAFAGPTTQRQLYEPNWQFLTPAAVPAAAGLLLGPAIVVLNPLTASAVADTVPDALVPYLEFWHGFSPELLLSAVTISIGMALFVARDPVDRFLNGIRTPPEGELFDRGYELTVRAGAAVGRPNRTSATGSFLIWPLLVLVGAGGVALVRSGGLPLPVAGTSQPADWAVVGLLAVACLAVALARRTLAAVALVGLVGLVVAGWFAIAGAPDVALTLFLAEALTAVVAVLVLRVLPSRFQHTRPRRTVPAALLAVAAGGLAVLGTLAFTGSRGRSELGDFFLANAPADTGGTNVVNTILVDYRALDTLGEATVLGVAALGLLMLLAGPGRGRTGGATGEPDGGRTGEPPAGRTGVPTDRMVFQVANRVLAPAMLLLSAYLFLRGHSAPGGGFIAALVAGAAVAFGWFARGRAGGAVPVLRSLRPEPLVTAGLLVSVVVGLAPLTAGKPFLTPLHAEVAGLGLSTSLLFDLGVYLFVLGLVVAAVERLGNGRPATGHRGVLAGAVAARSGRSDRGAGGGA